MSTRMFYERCRVMIIFWPPGAFRVGAGFVPHHPADHWLPLALGLAKNHQNLIAESVLNDGSSRPMAEMSCDPVPGVPKTFRRLLAGYLIHRRAPAGMKCCMSWVAQEHPTDCIAEKYRWNMEKQETRNTQLFRTIYQDDSLSRCKTALWGMTLMRYQWSTVSCKLPLAREQVFLAWLLLWMRKQVSIWTEPQCVCPRSSDLRERSL